MTCVFVPGNFGEDVVAELVAGIGERRVSLIGLPEIPAPRVCMSSASRASRTARTRSGSCSVSCRTSRATSTAGTCCPATSGR